MIAAFGRLRHSRIIDLHLSESNWQYARWNSMALQRENAV
jgi:hypothetical protein